MRALEKAIFLTFILMTPCAPLAAQSNPIPFINNLVPNGAVPGGPGFTLTVDGGGFISGSVVMWNGGARVTSFVSPTKLTAAILASDIATAQTVLVTVSNPAPGGGTSEAAFLGIETPATTIAFTRTEIGGPDTIFAPSGMTEGDFAKRNGSDLAIANRICPASQGCLLQRSDIAILLGGTSVGTEPYTAASPILITNGDFNDDGFLDLITMNGGIISVLLGNGDGTFQSRTDYPIPSGLDPGSVATGDFNRDGHLDLVVTNFVFSSVSILQGKGDGTFGAAPISINTGLSPAFVAVGDFNGDGKLDLAVSDSIANTISILLGNGDGTFQPPVDYPSGPFPTNIVIADFNHDGQPDLAVANNNGKVSIFLGKGDGTFQPKVDYPAGTAITSLATGDYNGDGKLDLAVSDSLCVLAACPANGSVHVLLGNGDGTFQSHLDFATGGDPVAIATGEFGGAGLGFATLNFQDNTVSVFTPNSTGSNPLPTISSISPPSVQAGSGGFILTVNGTNFVPGAGILFGGVAEPTTFVNSTQLTASIFATDVAGNGAFGVTVLNPVPGGGSSTSIALDVLLPPPTISSLNPPSVVAGGPAFTLMVNGSNFVNGAIVIFNGTNRATAFVSNTQLTIAISASDIVNQGTVNISVTEAPGAGSVGGTTSALPLSILPTNTQPVVGALFPASATAGDPQFTLKLTGVGFSDKSVVTFNFTSLITVFDNATLSLQAPIPSSAIAVAGKFAVTVANSGGNPSVATTFTVNNPVPGASSLSLSTVPPGYVPAAPLAVTGTNFNASSKVLVNGSSRATTFVSSTSLNATLPASDFAHSGTLNITVTNPTPGGGTTSALMIVVEDFNVSVPAPSNSVVAGNPASYSFMVTPSNGTTANSVTFSISGLPAGATPTFSPSATIPAGSGAKTVTLSIATTPHSADLPIKTPRMPWPLGPSAYLAAMAIVLLWLGMRALTGRVPRLASQFLLVSLLLLTAGLTACGGVVGSAAPSVNPSTGTPAGTYPVVVTATSGNGSLSTTVTLKVQ